MEKHNPYCRIVSITVDGVEYHYSQENDGGNEGIEVYYKSGRSRRFLEDSVPPKYKEIYDYLKGHVGLVAPGHKRTL